MQDTVRIKLAELVGRFGLDLCNDARRCEALLRDVCGGHKREINALVSAAREGVGSELRQSSVGVPKELIVARLTKRLHENLGLAEDLARWAVESWAVALGIATAKEFRFPFRCPQCGAQGSIATRMAGRRITCPKCSASLFIADNGREVFLAHGEQSPSNVQLTPPSPPVAASQPRIQPKAQPAVAEPPDPIAEAPEAIWYVRPPSGGQFGPATGDSMRTWMSEGRVSADSLVWREGWCEWREAATVFPKLRDGHSPPIPAVSGEGQIKPDDAYVYFSRGVDREGKQDWDAAIADYSEAIRLKPDYATAYFGRGNTRDSKGDLNGAIADYTEAIRLQPDNASAYFNRGNTRDSKGDMDGAIADYTEAIRLKPDHAGAYHNRGVRYEKKGDWDNAIVDYSEAIRLKRDYGDAYHDSYYGRGKAYAAKGDFDEAIADYSEAVRLKPDFANAYLNRGVAYAREGAWDAAIADYSEAIRLKPDYAEAYYRCGNAYAGNGNWGAAIADYSDAIRLQPDHAYASYGRGKAYAEKGDWDKAIADYSEAIRGESDHFLTYYNRGSAYEKKGELEKAIADYSEAMQIEPWSTISTIQTQVKDAAAVRAACQRLALPEPVQVKVKLVSGEVEGVAVKLPEWTYPVVCDLASGHIKFNNWGGRWGDQTHLDSFLQAYAVEEAKIEAHRRGCGISETALADGSIKLTIQANEGAA